ncbi:MFS transporter [Paenibacillus sp. N3/727]|uniref:MFS transporter n=1 Tax=Paenibacillus sp. N3/727 TaxID=2925845 RepID=UPI001F530228|nr:MFS transporter [Paenibacillus sp. N3/727]UNK17869.1 MFS transporter [Paenibacillus sp. N3/727]
MNIKQKGPLILLLTNLFIAFLGMSLVIPIMPTLMKELHFSGEIMGYLISLFAIAQLVTSPIAGIWVDRFGRKKPIVIGLFLFSASELIFAVGSDVWVLGLSRILGGISAALIMPAVTAFVADITTMEERPKALGYVSASISTGFIIGPGIGGYVAEWGIRVPFFLAAAVALSAAIFSLFMLKEPLSSEQMKINKGKKAKINIFEELKKSTHSVYFIPFIIIFVLSFGLSAFDTVFGLFVDSKFGFTPKDIATILTVSAILGTIAQIFLFGKLVQMFGERKLIQMFLLVSAVFLIISIFVRSYWLILGTTFVMFLAFDLLRPALTTLLSRMAGEDQGFVAGMNSTYTSFGNIIGPLAGGMLFDWNINFPYTFAALMLLIAWTFSVKWKEKPAASEAVYSTANE